MSHNCPKTLWIISEIYYPIKTSTAYYMTEIAEYMASKGIEVHVICTSATYSSGEKKSAIKYERFNKVYIHRISLPKFNKNRLISRITRLFLASLSITCKSLSLIKKGDSILSVTNPAFIVLFMPIVKSAKKSTYTLLVHDIFPENLIATRILSRHSLLYKIIKKVFDKAYSCADRCISIGRDMAEILKKKVSSQTAIEYIPIWAEVESVFPKEKNSTTLYNILHLQNKFIFQFAGNLGKAQGITNLLNAIGYINNPNIYFLFIGDGACFEEIHAFIQKNKQKGNVGLIGFQDRSKQCDFLNTCDVSIVTLNEGMYGLGVPSKSYNIMASGKPILYIGDENSEIALCIKEYSIGWIVEPNDANKLAETLLMIYQTIGEWNYISSNARKVAETIYAKNIILDKYYSTLIGK